jgi:putative phage-type endonuclease
MKIYKSIEQGSPEWHALRLGKVTGTRLKELMGKDNLSLVDELIAEMISGQTEDVFINFAMQRGTDLEPIARKAYEEYSECKVEEIGFIQSDKYEWFGMSPDGLIMEGAGKYLKAIEIKCPSTKKHVQYIRQGTLPAEYKYQVYASFLINEEQIEHDFISFDNRFLSKPIHIVNTRRADIAEELKEIEEAMEKFWVKFEKYYNLVTF